MTKPTKRVETKDSTLNTPEAPESGTKFNFNFNKFEFFEKDKDLKYDLYLGEPDYGSGRKLLMRMVEGPDGNVSTKISIGALRRVLTPSEHRYFFRLVKTLQNLLKQSMFNKVIFYKEFTTSTKTDDYDEVEVVVETEINREFFFPDGKSSEDLTFDLEYCELIIALDTTALRISNLLKYN
jgi:hypothetical protein